MTSINLRMSALVIRNIVLKGIEYRVHYWLLIVSFFISFFSDYLILKFSLSPAKNSFLQVNEVFSFVLWGLVVRTASTLWQEVMSYSREIRNGDFRRYLLQPIRFSQYFLSGCMGEKTLTWALIFLSVLLVKVFVPGFVFPGFDFWILFLLAVSTTWTLYYTFTLATFWAEESTFLFAAFNLASGVFSGSLVPFDWLPESVQKLVSLTPLKLLGDYPVRSALGRLSTEEFHGAVITGVSWLCILFVLNAYLFKKGTIRYESHGG